MAVVRSFMCKLMPRVPILKITHWRITSLRCASGPARPGLGTGSGPQINFIPQGDTITDEDDHELQNGANISNNINIINEDDIVKEQVPAQVDDYNSTDESPIAIGKTIN
ncbi:uncharacterized protein LOC126789087 [Argentina anserina]|uniref:uncharacterized protein LOC126789087 n=1 Tax=Argentina anserina TaxID=57926 RepID=UPI00217675DB|nr:uncharacterized protein LOC126789087 [Potentilla anserina]